MAQTADAVVIGGGINGSSIAFRLAKGGAGRVALVEKGHIASGPTGRSSGIVRQHYSLETLAAMARDSVRVFERFADEVGGDAGFVQVGVVFTCDQPEVAGLRSVMEMHARLGIREQFLSPAELHTMEPALSLDRVAAGCYEPDGGYADPALAAKSYSEAAARAGASVMRKTRVTALRVDRGRVAAVMTDKGEIATRAVVIAAGPWTPEVAGMAGVRIPIFATRHPVVILQRPVTWRARTPVWIDMAEGWYYKPEQQVGLMVGSIHNMGEEQTVDIERHATSPSYEEVEMYSEAAVKRFPVLEEGMAQGGWAGLYDMTPDSQPVLDRVPEIEGLFIAAGFSGHGFKLGPAIGAAMAEMVMQGTCRTYDLTPFRFDRFREGRLTRTAYEYGIIG